MALKKMEFTVALRTICVGVHLDRKDERYAHAGEGNQRAQSSSVRVSQSNELTPNDCAQWPTLAPAMKASHLMNREKIEIEGNDSI